MHRQASTRAFRGITFKRVLTNNAKTTTRHLSKNKSSERVRNYLDAWVGSNPSSSQVSLPKQPLEKAKSATKSSASKLPPLLLSGSSYLIPTLRVERNDTPESISTRIAAALEQETIPNTGIVKTMLQGKLSLSSDDGARWKAPIILDLHALVPDGSPHYEAPPRGRLVGLVQVLDKHGIRVVGVTNAPSILEQEAIEQLGLPAFMSKGRVLDRQSTSKVHVEQVIKMLLIKSQQDGMLEEEALEEGIDVVASNLQPVDDTVSEATKRQVDDDAEVIQDDPDMTLVNEYAEANTVDDSIPLEESTDNERDGADPSMPKPQGGTNVYHGSVRSGQQVVAKPNTSLVIIGSVNSGGEVMSDRDIFVFGKLRGRALAGLATSETGNARIFATSFDPELICIGDTFTTVDTVSELGLKKPGEAAMVALDSSSRELVFEHIPL